MPYKIKKIKGGYKVCKKNNPNKCFSDKPLTKKNAEDQMQAILANEDFQNIEIKDKLNPRNTNVGKFKKYYLSEMAIPISVAKKHIKQSRGDYKKLLDNVFQGKDRIIIDVGDFSKDAEDTIDISPLYNSIKKFLDNFNFTVTPKEYIKGIAFKLSDEDKKNPFKIGKLLTKYEEGDKSLLDAYKIDPLRQVDKDLKIVISRHPYDIAGMSTDRNWTSCMDLGTDRIIYKKKKSEEGSNSNFMKNYVENPTLISYLISSSDFNSKGKPLIQRPISRILLYPFRSDDGEIAYGYGEVYGVKSKEFQRQIEKWGDEVLNSGISEDKMYNKIPYVYYDKFTANFKYEMTVEDIFDYYDKRLKNIDLGTRHNNMDEGMIYDIVFENILSKDSILTLESIEDEDSRYGVLEHILFGSIPNLGSLWDMEDSPVYSVYDDGNIQMFPLDLKNIDIDDNDDEKHGSLSFLSIPLSILYDIDLNINKYSNDINNSISKLKNKINSMENDKDILDIEF